MKTIERHDFSCEERMHMQKEVFRRSWVEIDLNRIRKNIDIYRSNLRYDTEIMAVVKADAYGHGDVEVSKFLQNAGINLFAVSNINEAVRLREAGIRGSILILGYTPIESIEKALEYEITQTVFSEEYAKRIIEHLGGRCKELNVHIAIDTGMNRIGLNAYNVLKCESIIREYVLKFNVSGIFTHLCVADTHDKASVAFTKDQINRFEEVIDKVKDLNLPQIHCLNSAGGLWVKTVYNKITRLGIIMYGLKPDYKDTLPNGIESALTWKSVISMVKRVRKGETVGYGRTYLAEKDIMVATIPTGYADGYNRNLSNIGFVLIKGKRAPIIGRICMDQMMVDVSDIDVQVDDEVVLLGADGNNSFNADEMANMLGTIGYEVICDIGRRVQRVYKH